MEHCHWQALLASCVEYSHFSSCFMIQTFLATFLLLLFHQEAVKRRLASIQVSFSWNVMSPHFRGGTVALISMYFVAPTFQQDLRHVAKKPHRLHRLCARVCVRACVCDFCFFISPSSVETQNSRWHLGYIFVPVNALVTFSLALFYMRIHMGLPLV